MDPSPHPLSQFVVKMHSRCDLACDHCYVFEHADQSWRGRPVVISDELLDLTAQRIAEHARTHRLDTVHVVLHGGEPLLAGRKRLRRAAQNLSTALSGVSALDLRIHTNGVTLDEQFCELFAEYDIKVGVSLDGDRAANDLHRRYRNGRSSHTRVLRAIELLSGPRYRHLFAGLLCTVDLRNDPVTVYDALAELAPPRIDFLLPHATWDEPPPRPDTGTSATPYGDWLLRVHDRWTAAGRPMGVRVLDSVLRTLRGASSLTESLGLAPVELAVIETDGALEQADSLKTAYDGAPGTGLHVAVNSLDEMAAHPGVKARQQGLDGLCETCRACPVVRSCGGGLYAHRYRSEGGTGGFMNPSVYCADLKQLITGIRDREDRRTPMPHLPLDDLHLAEIAAGFGGGDAVDRLARHELTVNRELLAAVWHLSPHDETGSAAWETLAVLDAEAPESVDAVLAHPYLRPWAQRVLRGDGEAGPIAMRGVAELAAAALLRSGQAGGVTVPTHLGVLRLPTLGALVVGEATEARVTSVSDESFHVRVEGREHTVGPKSAADPAWWARHRFELPGWAVALEDTDPWRDEHGYPVRDRLSAAAAEGWHRDLAAAWEWIRRELPAYAPGLAAGLSVVTPLRESTAGADISSAARDAFGAVGIARPGTPQTLACLLVHEFQHVKLGAVLDVADLYDPTCERLFYAPWRPDPRPLEGLLQGTYAHIAVVDYWRARRRTAPGAEARDAEVRFARWREQTAEAVDTLIGSGALTDLGMRFVAAMGETVANRLTEPVDADALLSARRTAADHKIRTTGRD
ncbi:FxsB family cyclophane-forming radical SAM/SPASM peptide maturase [Streptomyces griseorubiginosus]|uniref:FxsB family cyclophane-forming radical SAM/SPASM peptide maturase n=1 Tax=Streptomyces griseorubiginosus TaxID=67304 RepID=UPI0011403AE2|nr:FxsB family cyclophane-forming radical SAM/SPASM peptide maturase [Streptomyces griseorubiginosus]